MRYYCEEKERVLNAMSSRSEGLDPEEVRHRIETIGRNRLEPPPGKSLLRRFLEQLADPMMLVLVAAATVSALLAFLEGGAFTEVFIILAVVVINAALGVYQENKAEKAIEALQEMAAASSKVLRSGKLVIAPSEELVPGDVLLLEAGDAVPADCRILESAGLKIEEAALTGESVPVSKHSEAITSPNGDVPLGDRKNMAYMGSTVVYGRGSAVICATGMDTEMGKIAGALSQAEEERTPLQIKLSQLSKILTWIVLGISTLVFAVQLLRADTLGFAPILDSFVVAVSLAVAAIPEGLVAVVTVVLSIGVTNMSKRNAIIRRLTAVETLGCAQVICSDKTGTLTQNKMTVTEFFGEDEKLCAMAMALCSDARQDAGGEVQGEPTEAALVNWAKKLGMDKTNLEKKHARLSEAPFDSARKMMSTLHWEEDGVIQYTKGAPDVILSRCSHYLKEGREVPLTDKLREKIMEQNKAMADKALRVLACARRKWETLPQEQSPEKLERQLCFIGICGMIDPVRPEAKKAIELCCSAGIKPVMITGDHLDTATAIARELGILPPGGKAISGAQLEMLDEESFERQYRDISVYARVQPEHKTRIVRAWQRGGCVTAMTGDGVNDAPSIKAADIGVGMGITGTDVTKNVADMILADDNFASIVSAVEEGRRVYDNIRKAVQFLLGSNMSEVISIFTAALMGFTILEPVQLLWINLVTDCFPALALGMEEAERDIMSRPPRPTKAGIFSEGLGWDVVYQGIMVSVLTLLAYFIGWGRGMGISMAFITLSMAEIFHSLNMRSRRGSIFKLKSQNRTLLLAAAASLLLTVLVSTVPGVAAAFGLAPAGIRELTISLALGASVLPIVETVKFFQRKNMIDREIQ